MTDDPFFFDLGAELAYRASRIASTNPPADIDASILTRGRDSFAGTNTLHTILRVPVTALIGTHGTTIGLTAFVQRGGRPSCNAKDATKDKASGKFVTLDRMATPAVNTVFTSYANKDVYNRSTPEDDAKPASSRPTSCTTLHEPQDRPDEHRHPRRHRGHATATSFASTPRSPTPAPKAARTPKRRSPTAAGRTTT